MSWHQKVSIIFLGGALILLTTSINHVEGQSCVAPPEGLTGWWSGDVDANDISGNDNHGTLQNGAQAGVPGKVAGAFSLDGMDDIIETAVTLPISGTLDLWLNPASLGIADGSDDVRGIIGTFGIANGANRLWVAATGPDGGPGAGPNRLPVNLGSRFVNDIDVASPLIVGEWTHLALTFDYDTDNYVLYVDGQPAGSSTALRNVPTELLSIGGLRSTFGQFFYFDGLIDEVELFDRVLSPEEIRAIYEAGEAGKCKGPILIFLPLILKW